MPNNYDADNPMHQRLLAALMLAVSAEDLVEYPGECALTSEGEARLLQVMAEAGCTREEIAAAMRLESGVVA